MARDYGALKSLFYDEAYKCSDDELLIAVRLLESFYNTSKDMIQDIQDSKDLGLFDAAFNANAQLLWMLHDFRTTAKMRGLLSMAE